MPLSVDDLAHFSLCRVKDALLRRPEAPHSRSTASGKAKFATAERTQPSDRMGGAYWSDLAPWKTSYVIGIELFLAQKEAELEAVMDDSGSASEGEAVQAVLVTEPPREKPSCLVPELLCEFMKVPATGTDVTLMAKIRAMAEVSEERRAPVTICAAIDRR